MTIQEWVAVCLAVVSGVYVLRSFYRSIIGKGESGCGNCSCSRAKTTQIGTGLIHPLSSKDE